MGDPRGSNDCPYPSWDLYWPEPWHELDDVRKNKFMVMITALIKHFEEDRDLIRLTDFTSTASVFLDYPSLRKKINDRVWEGSLVNSPDVMIACLGIAIHSVIINKDPDNDETNKKINVRIHNYAPQTSLRNLRSNNIGKFVGLKGTVIRVSNVKPLVVSMPFKCARCGTEQYVRLSDGKFSVPKSCESGERCRAKTFYPLRDKAITVDWQKIRLQEIFDTPAPNIAMNNSAEVGASLGTQGTTQSDAGRVPRTIEVELTEDLVDSVTPGDVVSLAGVVKVTSTETRAGPRNMKQNKAMYLCYIDANSIDNNKQVDTGKLDLMQFSLKEMYGIQKIASHKNPMSLIIKSICPSIYGHELVKAGLTLALFGGTSRQVPKAGMSVRGDIHILVVGDPGLGKSQLLQAVSTLAPRSVYVGGSYSSSSGLTVTLLRESASASGRPGGSSDYVLEAGALVLADQGVCCIDEFDKMHKTEHSSLLEAMEQQSISIAKAGIVCSLPARTTIIAAANPQAGHYNKAKTILQNLKLNPALLSRFDLIFILIDKPDELKDQLLSEHVIHMHNGGFKQSAVKAKKEEVKSDEEEADEEDARPLLDRLRDVDRDESPIPGKLLRKYIGYAKKYVQPTLSEEACQVLQEFYLSLREKQRTSDTTPVTTRQLESLIRLAEARAKLELRETVTKRDAEDVVEIMKQSIFDVFEDDFAVVADLRQRGGRGMSKQKMITSFVAELTRRAQQNNSAVFTKQQMYTIFHNDMQLHEPFDDFLEMLNLQNYVLKKGPQTYKLQTS